MTTEDKINRAFARLAAHVSTQNEKIPYTRAGAARISGLIGEAVFVGTSRVDIVGRVLRDAKGRRVYGERSNPFDRLELEQRAREMLAERKRSRPLRIMTNADLASLVKGVIRDQDRLNAGEQVDLSGYEDHRNKG